MGARGFLQERPYIGDKLPVGGGQQLEAADRSLHGRKVMLNSIGCESNALLLELNSKKWLDCKMSSWPSEDEHQRLRLRLSKNGLLEYRKKIKEYNLSDSQKTEIGESGLATKKPMRRGDQKSIPRHEDLTILLKFPIDSGRVSHFFSTNERYLYMREVKLIGIFLGIDFDPKHFLPHREDQQNWNDAISAHFPTSQETAPSGNRSDEREATKDDEGVLDDWETKETQQPCNPVAPTAAISNGSIQSPSTSQPNELEPLRLAFSLSLICLCLDRFSGGGWGFSLEEEYLIGDDYILEAGVDEVNLLCLHSLRRFLKKKSAYAIIKALEELARHGIRSSHSSLKHRKQALTSFSACMTDPCDEGERFMETFARMKCETEEAKASRDRYRIVKSTANYQNDINESKHERKLEPFLYLFYDRLHTLVGSLEKNGSAGDIVQKFMRNDETHDGPGRERMKKWSNHVKATRNMCLKTLKQHIFDLIENTMYMFKKPNQSYISKALQLLLLIQNPGVIEYICNEDILLERFDLDRKPTKLASEEALYCLLLKEILAKYNGDKWNMFHQAFEDHWKHLHAKLTSDSSSLIKTVSGMNAIGWGCLVQLIEYSEVNITTDACDKIWDTCYNVRQEMLNLVNDCKDAPAIRNALIKCLADVITEVKQENNFAKEFAESLLSRNTLILPDSSSSSTQESRKQHVDTHLGILEVEVFKEVTDLRVRSADHGYNNLFLLPFSSATGLKADTIERMKRVFGPKDSVLIQAIGEVVVEKCYEYQQHDDENTGQSHLSLRECNFIKRTEDIIKSLLNPNEKSVNSHELHDFLELRTKVKGSVKRIRRTASIKNGIHSDTTKTILWIFADVSIEWKHLESLIIH